MKFRFKKPNQIFWSAFLILICVGSKTLYASDTERNFKVQLRKAIYVVQRMLPEIRSVSNRTKFSEPSLAFEHYLELRLANLDADDKKKVTRLIRFKTDIKEQFTDNQHRPELDTYAALNEFLVHDDTQRILFVINTKYLVPSWVFYTNMVHEVEHYLQHLRIRKEVPNLPSSDRWEKISRSRASEKREKVLNFYTEVGAMLAEHRFQRMIPKREIPAILKKLRWLGSNADDREDTHRSFEARQIKKAYYSDVDYIRSEWNMGRYSLAKLLVDVSDIDKQDQRPNFEQLISLEHCNALLKSADNWE